METAPTKITASPDVSSLKNQSKKLAEGNDRIGIQSSAGLSSIQASGEANDERFPCILDSLLILVTVWLGMVQLAGNLMEIS